jgi:hypothetical protein
MTLIFSASSDTLSFQHTSRFLGPLIHWLLPGLSREATHDLLVAVRKGAHVSEFALLSLLAWRAFRLATFQPIAGKPFEADRGGFWTWHGPSAAKSLLLSLAYAISDELHQSFVPSRQASALDVGIDLCGALFALLLLFAASRWRRG